MRSYTTSRALMFAGALACFSSPALAQYTSYEAVTELGIDDAAITPDGRYAVFRENLIETVTYIIDLSTGDEVFRAESTLTPDCPNGASGPCAGVGPCNDAVEVTNERAITLGMMVKVIDLTATPPVEIAEHDLGIIPRDVAITSDGRYAIVRGGTGVRGGSYVIELGTGAIVLTNPSTNREFFRQLGNDLAAADSFHGVTLAYDESSAETEVLVVELDPAAGGGPQVVLDTALAPNGLSGDPMDVAMSPDGQYAAVRSNDEVAVVRLDGVNSTVVRTFSAFPGSVLPFGDVAMDTIVANDEVWASISVADGVTSDGYLNVQNFATGQNWFAFLDGVPRDLVLTPSGEKLMVHTGERVYAFDLSNLPTTAGLNNSNNRQMLASQSGILAGIDSIAVTEDRAIVMAPIAAGSRIRIYDLAQGIQPLQLLATTFPSQPIDVDITSDGSFAIAVMQEGYIVVDLRTLEEVVRVERTYTNPGYPWSDGAAIHPKHAAAFGIVQPVFDGWSDTIDLVSRESTYCESLPNSTGETADLFALGSTRVSENDLVLHAQNLPPNAFGFFILADSTSSVSMGAGIRCVDGTLINLPVVETSPTGDVAFSVDLTSLGAAGSGVIAGSTWNTQLLHRDLPSAGGFNYSNASSLLFE